MSALQGWVQLFEMGAEPSKMDHVVVAVVDARDGAYGL